MNPVRKLFTRATARHARLLSRRIWMAAALLPAGAYLISNRASAEELPNSQAPGGANEAEPEYEEWEEWEEEERTWLRESIKTTREHICSAISVVKENTKGLQNAIDKARGYRVVQRAEGLIKEADELVVSKPGIIVVGASGVITLLLFRRVFRVSRLLSLLVGLGATAGVSFAIYPQWSSDQAKKLNDRLQNFSLSSILERRKERDETKSSSGETTQEQDTRPKEERS